MRVTTGSTAQTVRYKMGGQNDIRDILPRVQGLSCCVYFFALRAQLYGPLINSNVASACAQSSWWSCHQPAG